MYEAALDEGQDVVDEEEYAVDEEEEPGGQ
jgi:hypothetical protein